MNGNIATNTLGIAVLNNKVDNIIDVLERIEKSLEKMDDKLDELQEK